MTKFEKQASVMLLIISIILFAAHYQWQLRMDKQIKQVQEMNYRLDKLASDQELLAIEINSIYASLTVEEQDIRITSYFPGDDYGSGTITASGLKVSDFEINENGWFTYHGMLVMACATTNYNNDLILPTSYKRYTLGSVITVVIDNVRYKAIIADICGASYWEEDAQRYDLFVKDNESTIDTPARVIGGLK